MRTGWKIRRISLYLLPFTFSLFFAGCYNYNQEITLNRDGSGTLLVQIEMKQFAFSSEQTPKVEKLERQSCETATMKFDQISGVELSSCEEWIEDYRIHEEAIYTFDQVSALSTEGWSYSWDREGAFKVLRVSFDTSADPPSDVEKEGAAQEMAGFRGARFKVTLPGTITDAPGAAIEGNTATWEYPWDKVIDEGLTRIDMEARVRLNFLQRFFGW